MRLQSYGIAKKGLVVLRDITGKAWLDKSRIVDGRFYYNCACNKELSDSNELVGIAKAKWSNIIACRDGYKYSD